MDAGTEMRPHSFVHQLQEIKATHSQMGGRDETAFIHPQSAGDETHPWMYRRGRGR